MQERNLKSIMVVFIQTRTFLQRNQMKVGSITLLPEVVPKSSKNFEIMAHLDQATTTVMMDTGADANCILREVAGRNH